MHIVLIGGVERREADLLGIARRAGHRLSYHSGDVGGRGADTLRAAIERSELIVVQTAVNSHGAMYLAKKLTHKLGKKLVVLRNCGPARFEALVLALGRATSADEMAACSAL